MKDKYNIKELPEKLDRCKNMKLEDINPGDVDEISSIKIDRRKASNERILDFLTKVINMGITLNTKREIKSIIDNWE